MIFVVMPRECIEPFGSSGFARELEAVGYDSVAVSAARVGTYVFTGLSLATREQRRALLGLEAELDGLGVRVLNRPSRVRDRIPCLQELLYGIRGVWLLNKLPHGIRYPVMVCCDDPLECTQSPLAQNEEDLSEIVARMVLTGFDPERIMALEVVEPANPYGLPVRFEAIVVPTSDTSDQLRDVLDAAGLDFARIEFGVVDGRVAVWRIDDGPLALLPRHNASRVEVERWRKAIGALREARGIR